MGTGFKLAIEQACKRVAFFRKWPRDCLQYAVRDYPARPCKQ